MSIGTRIAEGRKAKRLSQIELSKLVGSNQSTISDWERSHSTPSRREVAKLAEALDLSLVHLEFGEQGQEEWNHNASPEDKSTKQIINLVGQIGAGGHINPIDDHANGAGLDEVETPPNATAGTVAVVVRGDSLYPFLKDGALIYYSSRHDNVIDYLHEMVICHFTDGRKAVKVLTPGTEPGTFTLTSVNAPPMLNEKVESVSTIDWMKP